MGHTACTEHQCLYSTPIPLLPLLAIRPVRSLSACTVQLYLYSPYGPYGLYRASVPVQYSYTSTPSIGHTACTELQCLYSTAICRLPLLVIGPVQYSYTSTPPMGHTACTVQLYLCSLYWPYGLSACTVQLYLCSSYWPYGLYKASVPVQYSYTSTPPIGRTAYTEPQCLYSRAIPLLPLWAYGLYRTSVPVQ